MNPSLSSSSEADYSGHLLLQNPSLLLHLYLQKPDKSVLSSHLNSLVVTPPFSLQSRCSPSFPSNRPIESFSYLSRCIVIFSFSSSPHASSHISLKQSLIQTAYQIRDETPMTETPSKQASKPHVGRKRARLVSAESHRNPNLLNNNSTLWKSVFEKEVCVHPILGEAFVDPIVLFDGSELDQERLEPIDYVKRLDHVYISNEYERLVRLFRENKPERVNIPLCLVYVSNTISYPFGFDIPSSFV